MLGAKVRRILACSAMSGFCLVRATHGLILIHERDEESTRGDRRSALPRVERHRRFRYALRGNRLKLPQPRCGAPKRFSCRR